MSLNDRQQEAVLHTEGPLLVLAGAGSGKTRVLTHRIAHLIKEKNVAPWSILAITFTNKAATEMKERASKLVQNGDMWISTFHSMCVRMLRRDAELLGYDRYFTIYDTADQKVLIKEVMKQLDISEKNFPVGQVLGAISNMKNQLILPSEAKKLAGAEFREYVIADIYDRYQDRLFNLNAMDFDDLLVNVCILLQTQPQVLDYYQRKFKYILVDEYQDTNMVQYKLVQMLAGLYQNLCVVGDDDQSIYGWRGADIKNILGFEKDFDDVMTIKLEENYRSTKNILDAANKVVANNRNRKHKALWTAKEKGDPIYIMELDNEYKEAVAVADKIVWLIESGTYDYKDFAILYRTNAQSRALEEKMIAHSIPYRLLGGVRFYERKEIKDLLAYLRVIANGKDDIALKRIINVPKRGIGAATISKIELHGIQNGLNFFEAASDSIQNNIVSGAAAQKIREFVSTIEALRETKDDVRHLVDILIEKVGYLDYIKNYDDEDPQDRIKNIEELVSKAQTYMQAAEEPTLDQFLEEIALVADVDNYDENSNSIVLMTLHSAKGLEFPVVFLTGLEEGLFPSYMSIKDEEYDDTKLEEERRLAYVGITRAMEKLYLTYATERMVYGQTKINTPSRFINEIPTEITNREVNKRKSYQPEYEFKQQYKQQFSKPRQKIENVPPYESDINMGDVVKHRMFGRGTVTELSKTSDDVFATIEFDSGQTRKLSVKFARLQKVK
ncbi:MAG: ATP-dependent DNA helicase PcrA [Epulopiscium sp. Nele67-Bin004]|nr:MAG: ATP-dependent DNA helicase PcrA [Epulopiscium sp. Nele67-Bin004]